jgi:hypothetical protein
MGGGSHYWLARLVFTRTLVLVYLIAFLCALNQFRPLLGQHGLEPVPDYIARVPFRASPSLFYFLPKDWAFATFAWAGIALSCVAISGIADRQAIWWSSLARSRRPCKLEEAWRKLQLRSAHPSSLTGAICERPFVLLAQPSLFDAARAGRSAYGLGLLPYTE